MPVAERLLVDTNILPEATDAKRPYRQEARELIESYRGLVLPAQVIREYLVVTTRPTAANGLGMSLRTRSPTRASFVAQFDCCRRTNPCCPRRHVLLSTTEVGVCLSEAVNKLSVLRQRWRLKNADSILSKTIDQVHDVFMVTLVYADVAQKDASLLIRVAHQLRCRIDEECA